MVFIWLFIGVVAFMGSAHYAYLNGATNSFGGLGKICCGKTPRAHCFLVERASEVGGQADPYGSPRRIRKSKQIREALKQKMLAE